MSTCNIKHKNASKLVIVILNGFLNFQILQKAESESYQHANKYSFSAMKALNLQNSINLQKSIIPDLF